MAYNTYAAALKVFGKTSLEHDANCKKLTTAKIFADICTERVQKSKGSERELQIEKAKQKQEQFKDVVTNYNDSYGRCRESLTIAAKEAPSSRTKQDVLDSLSSLDSKHIDNRSVCETVTTFLETDFANLQEEAEPANN